MRGILIAAVFALVGVALGACDNVDEIEVDGRHDGGTDADADSDSDSDADSDADADTDVECDAEDVPDFASTEECTFNLGWPCMCTNTWFCDNGVPCQGHDGLMNASIGSCAPQCADEEPFQCPTTGMFGMGVVEICDSWLTPGECMCLLSGCEDTWDCPYGGHCVEPSCIPTDIGCPEGEGEVRVCYPDNW